MIGAALVGTGLVAIAGMQTGFIVSIGLGLLLVIGITYVGEYRRLGNITSLTALILQVTLAGVIALIAYTLGPN